MRCKLKSFWYIFEIFFNLFPEAIIYLSISEDHHSLRTFFVKVSSGRYNGTVWFQSAVRQYGPRSRGLNDDDDNIQLTFLTSPRRISKQKILLLHPYMFQNTNISKEPLYQLKRLKIVSINFLLVLTSSLLSLLTLQRNVSPLSVQLPYSNEIAVSGKSYIWLNLFNKTFDKYIINIIVRKWYVQDCL